MQTPFIFYVFSKSKRIVAHVSLFREIYIGRRACYKSCETVIYAVKTLTGDKGKIQPIKSPVLQRDTRKSLAFTKCAARDSPGHVRHTCIHTHTHTHTRTRQRERNPPTWYNSKLKPMGFKWFRSAAYFYRTGASAQTHTHTRRKRGRRQTRI